MSEYLTFTNLLGKKISIQYDRVSYFEERDSSLSGSPDFTDPCCVLRLRDESNLIFVRESHDEILERLEKSLDFSGDLPITSSTTDSDITSQEVEPEEEDHGNS